MVDVSEVQLKRRVATLNIVEPHQLEGEYDDAPQAAPFRQSHVVIHQPSSGERAHRA